MSDSVRPHRRQPTRLPRPWDSPGKNTGVGCHFLLQCMKVRRESEVAQSCPTLATPWTAAYQTPPSMGFSRQKYWTLPTFYQLKSHPSLWSRLWRFLWHSTIFICLISKDKKEQFFSLFLVRILMRTNMGKMFLEGDLAKAVRSLKIYLTFDTEFHF